MSWEREDSLRRKVREARERRAFKDSIETVLSAKEAQGTIRTQREAEAGQVRQDKVARQTQREEHFDKKPQASNTRTNSLVRDGRPGRER